MKQLYLKLDIQLPLMLQIYAFGSTIMFVQTFCYTPFIAPPKNMSESKRNEYSIFDDVSSKLKSRLLFNLLFIVSSWKNR